MTGRLTICRGIPGSGKSTLAQEIKKHWTDQGYKVVVCSADNYFMHPVDGDPAKSEYRFDAARLGNAHAACRQQAEDAMQAGVDFVIVDNTNVRSREMLPYVEAAVMLDYDIELVEPQTPWWHSVRPLLRGKDRREKDLRPHAKVFAARNTHRVPEDAILRMLTRWDSDVTSASLVDQVIKESV